jgi:DNA-binding NtrC family response regulator
MATRILLVEDDPEQAILFAKMLEMFGYPMETVASAEEAQTRLTAEPFALLLADWDLGGGMNGDALIAWAKMQYPGMKTILFSNHPQVDEIAATYGADAAFRKIEGIVKLRQLMTDLVPLGAD